MLRALLWKEWRQQRQIAAAGIGMALVMPPIIFAVIYTSMSESYVKDIVDMIPFMTAALVWPLFAALAGATTNADEVNDGSLGFLLSRPVPRWGVWAAKVAVAATVLAIIMVGSFGLARILDWMVGGYGIMFPFTSDPVGDRILHREAVQTVAVGLPLVAFACSAFVAMFMRRQIAAALAGVGAALMIVATGFRLQTAISAVAPRSYGSESFLSGFFLLAATMVLIGALYVFAAGAMLRGADRRLPVLRAAMVILLAMTGGTALVAHATTRTDPATAELLLADLLPDGQGMVIRARQNTFVGDSYWLARPGEPMRQLTRRMALGGTVTPDGEWLLYATRAGALGLRTLLCEYRAVRPDGTGDRLIAEDMPCTRDFVFSEDGGEFAAEHYDDALTILAVDGDTVPRIVPVAGEGSFWTPVSWAANDSRVVMHSSRRGLWQVDIATGETSHEYGGEDLRRLYLRATSRSRVVVEREWRAREADELVTREETVVVDLETGNATALPEHCPEVTRAVALSPDGNLLFYPGCPNSTTEGGQLRVRDFRTEEDRVVAEFDGQIFLLSASPQARTFLVTIVSEETEGRRGRYRDFVVDLDGNVRDLDFRYNREWYSGEWVDDSRLVFWRPDAVSDRQFAYLDVWTGAIQIVTDPRGTGGGQAR